MSSPITQSDEQLAVSALQGDQEAFTTLYQNYFDQVYDLASRVLKDSAAAADVAQNVFMKFLGGAEVKPPQVSFRAWLYTMTRNAAIDELRRRQRMVPLAGTQMEEDLFSRLSSSPQDDPERVTLDNELAALVWEAARALNPNDYTLLDLNIRKGLGPEELAAALGTTRGNVYTRLSRLRDSLEEAVTTLILARRARGDCSELNELLLGSDPAQGLTPRARRAISRHIQDCPACETNRRRYLSATALFGGLAAVAPGLALKTEIWGGLAAAAAGAPPPPPPSPPTPATQSAQAGSSGSAGGASEVVKAGAQLWSSLGAGVQAVVVSLAVAGAIGAGVAATVLSSQSAPPPLPTVLQLRLVDPDVGADGIARNRQLQIEVQVASGDQGIPSDLQWLMQEAPTSTPSPQDPGWSSWPPGVFTLSEGDGLKVVDLWLKSPQGEVTHGEQAQVLLDTTIPQDPTSALSSTHDIGVPSANNLVTVQWEPAVDPEPGSGIAGYSVLWDQSPNTVPDGELNLDASASEATSPPLDDGSWHFHLSTQDLAGNRTNTLHLGPFIIETNIPPASSTGGNGGTGDATGGTGDVDASSPGEPDPPQPLEDLPAGVTPPDAPELDDPEAPVQAEPEDSAADEPQPAQDEGEDETDSELPFSTQFDNGDSSDDGGDSPGGSGSNGDQTDNGQDSADPPGDAGSNGDQTDNGQGGDDPPGDAGSNGDETDNGQDGDDPPGDAGDNGDQTDNGQDGDDPPGDAGDGDAEPVAVLDVHLDPLKASLTVGSTHTLAATVSATGSASVADVLARFQVIDGPTNGVTGSSVTNADGLAQFSYQGEEAGTDTIQACVDDPNVGEICSLAYAAWADLEENPGKRESCLGENSCQGVNITVGRNSCNADNTCIGNNIVIGDNSCNQEGSCIGNGIVIGDRSCNGRSACQGNQMKVSDDSCNADESCRGNGNGNGNGNNSNIGNGSCNGKAACTGQNIAVGDNSCNGAAACTGNNNNVGNEDCNEPGACSVLDADGGD